MGRQEKREVKEGRRRGSPREQTPAAAPHSSERSGVPMQQTRKESRLSAPSLQFLTILPSGSEWTVSLGSHQWQRGPRSCKFLPGPLGRRPHQWGGWLVCPTKLFTAGLPGSPSVTKDGTGPRVGRPGAGE